MDRQSVKTVRPWLHLVLACLMTTGLTVYLSGTHFHNLLSSDHLYPHLFVKDWLYGEYPIDAWRFGSATFLFPDYLVYGPLLAALGDSGITFPVFAVVNMLMMGAACGFAIHRTTEIDRVTAFAAGYTVLGGVLTLQFLPWHGFNLYWLLLPGFHGSSIVLGIGLTAVLIGCYGESRPLTNPEKIAVIVIGTLGVYSNTLLLTQFLIPWLATLIVLGWLGESERRVLFAQHWRIVLAIVVGVIALRIALTVLNFWEQGRIFRHFPFPAAIWSCFLDFLSEFGSETGVRLWAFWGLYLVLISVAVHRFTFRTGRADFSGWPVWVVFVILSVFSGVLLPVASLYWQDFNSSRYFLNLLVLPALALGITLLANMRVRHSFGRWIGLVPIALIVVVVFGLLVRNRDRVDRLVFAYPDRVAEFDRIVSENKLTLGLSNYWNSHLYNQLGESNAFLNHVGEDGAPVAWCNNLYWYYGPRDFEERAPLEFPDYDFVLMNGLDEIAVRERYGEPVEIVRGVFNTVFIYKGRSHLIRSSLAPEIAGWLDGKKLEVSSHRADPGP